MSKQTARHRQRQQHPQRTAPQRRYYLSLSKLTIFIAGVLLLSLAGVILARWHGARLASRGALMVTAPTPTPAPLQLSKEYIYAGGKLIATEEPSNISTLVTAPAALIAGTVSATQINLTWTASTGPVTYYQIERGTSAGGPFTLLSAQPTTNSFLDTSVSDGTAYLYRVRAVDTSGSFSPYSNIDLASAVTFVDDPLAGSTPIKAQHLMQLRQAVNAVRAVAGLNAASWTDPSPQGLRIRAVHIQELRTALDQALAALNLPVQPYTDSTLTNARVKKEHFEQLRQRVK